MSEDENIGTESKGIGGSLIYLGYFVSFIFIVLGAISGATRSIYMGACLFALLIVLHLINNFWWSKKKQQLVNQPQEEEDEQLFNVMEKYEEKEREEIEKLKKQLLEEQRKKELEKIALQELINEGLLNEEDDAELERLRALAKKKKKEI